MTKSINPGYTDTPIDGVTELNFERGLLNLKEDFRIKKNDSGKEVILTNITSPIDRPENIRLAYNDVPNVYTGTGIEPSLAAPTKRGVSILAQRTEVLTVSDSTDADFRVDLPISCHLVIKVPSSEHVSAEVVKKSIGRLLSSLYDTGSESDSRLEAILRGSLTSREM